LISNYSTLSNIQLLNLRKGRVEEIMEIGGKGEEGGERWEEGGGKRREYISLHDGEPISNVLFSKSTKNNYGRFHNCCCKALLINSLINISQGRAKEGRRKGEGRAKVERRKGEGRAKVERRKSEGRAKEERRKSGEERRKSEEGRAKKEERRRKSEEGRAKKEERRRKSEEGRAKED
jgi:hypothetical protein